MKGRGKAKGTGLWNYCFLIGSLFLIVVNYFQFEFVDVSGFARALKMLSLSAINNVASTATIAMLPLNHNRLFSLYGVSQDSSLTIFGAHAVRHCRDIFASTRG